MATVRRRNLIEYYHISSDAFATSSKTCELRCASTTGSAMASEVRIPENGIETYGSYEVKAIEPFPFFQVRDGAAGNRLIWRFG